MTAYESRYPTPICVLVLEDYPSDAELMIRELRRAGYDPQWQRVETEDSFLAALANAPELILSDFALPGFDGLQALAKLRERGLEIPFIMVSGTLGEEAVVEAMKQGATDFLVKDRLARLGPAVARALEEKRLRDELSAHAAKIARLSRIRAVIGGISSAMLRIRDPADLLCEACRVAVIDGVFPLAWVTTVDAQSQALQIIGAHGIDAEAKARLQREMEAIPVDQRPAYQVLRTGQRFIANDQSFQSATASLSEALQLGGYRSGGAFPLRIGGKVVAVLGFMANERNFFDAEEIALLEWLTADLSFALESIETAARLDHLAYYDSLTGLCNASLFLDRLNQLLHAAEPEQGKVCVVVLDLEGFTHINDSRGRAAGDQLLRLAGVRFGEFLTEPCVLARISADTFAAASSRDGESAASKLCDQMFAALKEPLSLNGDEVLLSAQAGIALSPADGADAKALFMHAEEALKRAKSSGARLAYYSSALHEQQLQRSALQERLRKAAELEQFVLYYQARVDMHNGELIGAEALIRWQDPQRGLVEPAEFIALTEESGLIVPIGAWAIETVCRQQAAWIAAGACTVPVAVNLSSVQFEKGDLLQTVRSALNRYRLPASQLGLELTESAVMKDPAAATKTLQALRNMGVRLALDDFGTGYSSLAHLRQFPFDSVKIDRSFVTDITNNAGDAAIASAIISMAHHLNMKVVAEGVETQGQFNYLRAHGCNEMQGFLFGAAVPHDIFEGQLSSRRRLQLPPPAAANQRTLLLVDDEPGIGAALNRLLRREGYRIINAASGAEGLALLAENDVQVIISDQRMPGMTGTDFLNTVKQLYPATVRIILSGYTDLAVVTDAVNRGAVFKFLTKPWDDEMLREQVRDAFRRYQPMRT